jgi:hypothetical protein
MEVVVCVTTTNATVSRATPGMIPPKYLPVIVMVGGFTARSAVADVITGSTAQAGVTPNKHMHILPSTARRFNTLLLRCSDIIFPFFVFKSRHPFARAETL